MAFASGDSINAVVSYDYIPSSYYGYYYCEQNDNYWMFLTGATDVTFRGLMSGYGLIAATEVETIYFAPSNTGSTDNFSFCFSDYAKVVDGSFTPTGVSATVFGHYYKADRSIRIKATSSSYYYYYE